MAGKFKTYLLLLLGFLHVGHPESDTFESLSQNFCAEMTDDQIQDNLSCPSVPELSGQCISRTALCNGVNDCNDASDEGGGPLSSLRCDLSTPMFDCGDEEFIPLEDLCNGFDDCSFSTSPGSDEQAVICDNKCLAPYYGGCDQTRMCTNMRNNVTCGLCFPGLVDIPGNEACGSLKIEDVAFEEGGTNPAQVCATLSPPMGATFSTAFSISIPITFIPVSAGNNDYVQITTTLILSTEALTGCILFDIVDDSFIEQIEIFTIRARFGTVTVDARIAIFSEDEQNLLFAFNMNPILTNEGTPTLEVCVDLISGTILQTLPVVLDPVPGSAGVDDFEDVGMLLVFFANPPDTQKCATFNIRDDSIAEPVENFTIVGTRVEFVGGQDSVEIFITDNDITVPANLEFSFTMNPVQTLEGSPALVCVQLEVFGGNLSDSVAVLLDPLPGTAGISDFEDASKLLTFTASPQEMCATFNTLDDSIAESTEQFMVNLLRTSSLNAEDSTTVLITDNDAQTLTFAFPVDSVTTIEGVPAVVCVQLLSDIGTNDRITLFLDPTPGSASGDDFDDTAMPVEFPANSTVDTLRCANFSIIDDDVVENVEEFTVTPSGGTFANGQDLVEVIIRDNDARCPEDNFSIPYFTSSMLVGSLVATWPESSVGTVFIPCPCGNLTMLLPFTASRMCILDAANQAQWLSPNVSQCQELSFDLCNISELPVREASERLMNFSMTTLTAVQFVQISFLVSSLTDPAVLDSQIGENFLDAINALLSVDRDVIFNGQVLGNAAARIIESIEIFSDLRGLVLFGSESGKVMFQRQNFAILIVVQERTPPSQLVQAGSGLNINGDIDFTEGPFTVSSSNTLPNNLTGSLGSVLVSSTLAEVFQNTSLQSDDLTRLIFVSYGVNSTLFQDRSNLDDTGVILSVLRSPQQGPAPVGLEEPVKFQFQVSQRYSEGNVSCVFWNFTLNDELGGWSSEGCALDFNESNDTAVVCLCDHLTSFTILVDLMPPDVVVVVDTDVDKSFSYVGGIISAIFLIITLITNITSQQLRSSEYGQNLIQMCCALIGLYVAFMISSFLGDFYPDIPQDPREPFCAIFSALVHYFILMYLIIIAAQSVELVVVLHTQDFLNRYIYSLMVGISWIVPAVWVVVFLASGHEQYANETEENGVITRAVCFPMKLPFFLGLLTPAVILYSFNLIMLIVVLVTMQRNHNGEGSKWEKLTYILAFLLTVLFGVGWLFGVLGLPGVVGRGGSIAFQIFFILIIGGHGFLLFIILPLRSEDARYEWKRWYYYVTCRPRLFHQTVFNSHDHMNRANHAADSARVRNQSKRRFMASFAIRFRRGTRRNDNNHDGSTTIDNPAALDTSNEQREIWTRVQGLATDDETYLRMSSARTTLDENSTPAPDKPQRQHLSTEPTSDVHSPSEIDELDTLDDFSLSVNEALKMKPRLCFMPFTPGDEDSSFESQSPTMSDQNATDTWPYNEQLSSFSTFKPLEENKGKQLQQAPHPGKGEPEQASLEVNTSSKPKTSPIYENVWPRDSHLQTTSFSSFKPDEAGSRDPDNKQVKPQPTPRSAKPGAIESDPVPSTKAGKRKNPEADVRSGKALPSNFDPFQVEY